MQVVFSVSLLSYETHANDFVRSPKSVPTKRARFEFDFDLFSAHRRLDGNPLECDCGWVGALDAVSNVTASCVNGEGSENDVGRLSCGDGE